MVLVKLSEAEKRTGIPSATLRNWIKSGRIEGKVIKSNGDGDKRANRYFMEEHEIEKISKSEDDWQADEDEQRTNRVVNEIDLMRQHLNGLSQSIKGLVTDSAIQANQERRNTIETKLDRVSYSQQQIYKKINIFITIVEQLQTDMDVVKSFINEHNMGKSGVNFENANDLCANFKNTNDLCVSGTSIKKKQIIKDDYDKFGGR